MEDGSEDGMLYADTDCASDDSSHVLVSYTGSVQKVMRLVP